jgi:hypothetical protein
MNLKGGIKIREVYCPEIFLKGMRKNMKDLKIICVLSKIRTGNLFSAS